MRATGTIVVGLWIASASSLGCGKCGDPGGDAGNSTLRSTRASACADDTVECEAVVTLDCGMSAKGCSPAESDHAAAQLAGPFTLAAEVRLDKRPKERAVVISRWGVGRDRSFELGIDDLQQPYLVLSADGSFDRTPATSIHALTQLRLGRTHELAVVVEPGKAATFYLDGVEADKQTKIVETLHVGQGKLGIGRRPDKSGKVTKVDLGRVRIFDRALTSDEIGAIARVHGHEAPLPELPKMRALTKGPKFHWFGYYDKFQFDPTDRYVLGMAADFENREVTANDTIQIGMVDTREGDKWIDLGTSRAWSWQQGCMLQWIPGSEDEVIWNDREGDGAEAKFVARIVDVGSGERRTLAHPIYTITPDGKTALGIDFERLIGSRRSYGYQGVADRRAGVLAPKDGGIYKIDMKTGESELVVTVAQTFAHGRPAGAVPEHKHFIEMLQINESGTRFLFYERWVPPGKKMRDRVFTANLDGSDLYMVSEDKGTLSHVTWLDDRRIVIYATAYNGYAVFEDKKGYVSTLLPSPRDGHQTFLAGDEWMVSDTYADMERLQHPFLYHLPSDEIFALAHLHSPPAYRMGFRCDTHPRVSRDGRKIVIDSPHRGGRQMYMIEIGEILDSVGK